MNLRKFTHQILNFNKLSRRHKTAFLISLDSRTFISTSYVSILCFSHSLSKFSRLTQEFYCLISPKKTWNRLKLQCRNRKKLTNCLNKTSFYRRRIISYRRFWLGHLRAMNSRKKYKRTLKTSSDWSFDKKVLSRVIFRSPSQKSLLFSWMKFGLIIARIKNQLSPCPATINTYFAQALRHWHVWWIYFKELYSPHSPLVRRTSGQTFMEIYRPEQLAWTADLILSYALHKSFSWSSFRFIYFVTSTCSYCYEAINYSR